MVVAMKVSNSELRCPDCDGRRRRFDRRPEADGFQRAVIRWAWAAATILRMLANSSQAIGRLPGCMATYALLLSLAADESAAIEMPLGNSRCRQQADGGQAMLQHKGEITRALPPASKSSQGASDCFWMVRSDRSTHRQCLRRSGNGFVCRRGGCCQLRL
jgi:hypothetical protein